MIALAGNLSMPTLAPEQLGPVQSAKDKASAFKKGGSNGQGDADQFLASASQSVKRQGSQELDEAPNAAQMRNANTNQATSDDDAAGINWNYDKLDDRREHHSQNVKDLNAMDGKNPLQDHELRHSEGADKRLDLKESARQGMDDGGWDIKDIKGYNPHAHGSKKFDKQDVAFLREQGASDALVSKYIKKYGKKENGLNQSITHNKDLSDISGDHYIGDMADGAKASDYDWGDGMGKAEINYLKQQGFSDEDIYSHARSNVAYGNDDLEEDSKKYGIRTHRWLDKQGLYDDWGQETEADPGPEDGTTPTPEPETTTPETTTPEPTPEDPGDGSGGVPESPMSPGYGGGGGYDGSYNVHGNPYSATNPGYYYGTEQQAKDTARYNQISDNAATAHAKGLSDIGVWQEQASAKTNYMNNVMHELYSSMGLTGFMPNNNSDGVA